MPQVSEITAHEEVLKHLRSDWFHIAFKAKAAEKNKPHDPITPEEIAFLLENSGEGPPPIIRKLLAKLLRGEFKLKKGIRPRPFSVRWRAVHWFFELENAISQYQQNHVPGAADINRGELSSRELALMIVADEHNVTTRTLENWFKEYETLIIDRLKPDGRPFKNLRDAMTYSEGLYTQAKHRSSLQGWPLPPLK